MGNITSKKQINWTVRVQDGDVKDVKILTNNRFNLPVLSDTEDLTVNNFTATNGTYVYLFPITGRAQLYIEHDYKGEYDMPMELRDTLRV